MTDSENSQPQDDSDDDIYKDIPEFNFEDELAKLEGSKETYKQKASDLTERVKALTEENKELKKSNEVLKKNISALLKTAQAEVQRKDSMIQELRTKVKPCTFRSNRKITKDKHTSTDDLELSIEAKPERVKGVSEKRSKSHENRTSSESERKSSREKEKRKESSTGREDYSDCDNDRHSGKNSKTNFRHSDKSQDRHRDKKSTKYGNSSEYSRSYWKDHRDHLKCDSYDKKRHSRSSDSRFLSRRRNSRERKSDNRREDSSGRRSDESSERSRMRKGRSRSREIFRRSKESPVEKSKTRSSLDKDIVMRVREQSSTKPEVSDSFKSCNVVYKKKTETDCLEKQTVQKDATPKSKQHKDKRGFKHEKQSSFDMFNSKSPLDALYRDMMTSKNSNRFGSSKSGTIQPESDLEDGEISTKQHLDLSDNQQEEDWTLSFKNERKNETKPMTLYSRRMMQKISTESRIKTPENKIESEETPIKVMEETEKEPGELTDDEHIVESSKEFQELTKVASVETELVESSSKEKTFKEPRVKDFPKMEISSTEQMVKEEQNEAEKPTGGTDEVVSKEADGSKETREVIEFSPFKNNYKLIEISPMKPPSGEHVLDFYHRRELSGQAMEESTSDSTDPKDKSVSEKSIEKSSDISEEKTLEAELKIIIPLAGESPSEKEMKEIAEKKQARKSKEKTEDKGSKNSKKDDAGRGKRRSASKKETEKPSNKEKSRKRKPSETQVVTPEAKKRKMEKSEPSRKSSRTKRNSKGEPETPKAEPEPESEKAVKEDILAFEFFKPVTKADVPETPGKMEITSCAKTTMTSVMGIVRLETPNKFVEKVKNLTFSEHMISNVMDLKNDLQFSPLIGPKCMEMTPRRMLKNDLMLTDSEDDSINKTTVSEEAQDEEEDGEADETLESDNSGCNSDSGASDFVDLL